VGCAHVIALKLTGIRRHRTVIARVHMTSGTIAREAHAKTIAELLGRKLEESRVQACLRLGGATRSALAMAAQRRDPEVGSMCATRGRPHVRPSGAPTRILTARSQKQVPLRRQLPAAGNLHFIHGLFVCHRSRCPFPCHRRTHPPPSCSAPTIFRNPSPKPPFKSQRLGGEMIGHSRCRCPSVLDGGHAGSRQSPLRRRRRRAPRRRLPGTLRPTMPQRTVPITGAGA